MSNSANNSIDERIKKIKSLIQQGKPDYAQFENAKLVAEYPHNVMVLCSMSYVFHVVNEPRNSWRYAKKACEEITQESTWQEIVSASNALMMVGNVEDATGVMRSLDLSKVEGIQNLSYIAKHYGNLEQVEIAAKIFDGISGEELDFHSRQMYGVALLYLGKFAEARVQFEKAIALNPQDGVSYNQLSVLKEAEGRDGRVEKMLDMLADPRLDPVNRSYMHFSLFNELDQGNRPDDAWAHLEKANKVRRNTVHHDAPHDVEGGENIMLRFKKSLPSADSNVSDATPIFIVGLPRTGTTLLEKILSSFDEVQACGELRAFRRELEIATNSNFISPFGLGFQSNIEELDYKHIGSEYIRKNHWRHEGKKFFTDKEPSNYVYAGLITKAIPNARIIHIKRNPMDACFSSYKQFFGPSSFTYSYDLAELAEHYKLYAKMMQFWKEQIPDSMLEISYESLVNNPDFYAETIRSFCGLSSRVGALLQSSNYITSTLSAAQVRAPIHNKNINAWQRHEAHLAPLYAALQEYIVDYAAELEIEMNNARST